MQCTTLNFLDELWFEVALFSDFINYLWQTKFAVFFTIQCSTVLQNNRSNKVIFTVQIKQLFSFKFLCISKVCLILVIWKRPNKRILLCVGIIGIYLCFVTYYNIIDNFRCNWVKFLKNSFEKFDTSIILILTLIVEMFIRCPNFITRHMV